MTQIIILAAGKGSRMHSDTPKVLQHVNGRPMIEIILENAVNCGISNLKPIVVVGYGADRVKAYLGDRVKYALQTELRGTGDAVACALSCLNEGVTNVAVMYGDMVFLNKQTVKDLINKHLSEQAVETLLTVKVPDYDDWRQTMYAYGRIIRDENDHIQKIVELKDTNNEEKLIKEVNHSFVCFNRSWLDINIKKLNNNNTQNEYYLTDLVGIAIDQDDKVATLTVTDSREGIGVNTVDHLRVANELSE